MISDNMDQVNQREKNGFSGLYVKELKDIFHNRIPSIDELRYPFEDVVIWGATARILHHLIELLYPLFGSIPADKAYDVGDNHATA